jgi:hypothetical protein
MNNILAFFPNLCNLFYMHCLGSKKLMNSILFYQLHKLRGMNLQYSITPGYFMKYIDSLLGWNFVVLTLYCRTVAQWFIILVFSCNATDLVTQKVFNLWRKIFWALWRFISSLSSTGLFSSIFYTLILDIIYTNLCIFYPPKVVCLLWICFRPTGMLTNSVAGRKFKTKQVYWCVETISES